MCIILYVFENTVKVFAEYICYNYLTGTLYTLYNTDAILSIDDRRERNDDKHGFLRRERHNQICRG